MSVVAVDQRHNVDAAARLAAKSPIRRSGRPVGSEPLCSGSPTRGRSRPRLESGAIAAKWRGRTTHRRQQRLARQRERVAPRRSWSTTRAPSAPSDRRALADELARSGRADGVVGTGDGGEFRYWGTTTVSASSDIGAGLRITAGLVARGSRSGGGWRSLSDVSARPAPGALPHLRLSLVGSDRHQRKVPARRVPVVRRRRVLDAVTRGLIAGSPLVVVLEVRSHRRGARGK